MARTFTVAEIESRARNISDMTDTDFVTSAEAITYIDSEYTDLYDLLTEKFESYNVSTTPHSITLVTGTTLYDLPTDFYKAAGVEKSLGGGKYRSLLPFNFQERNDLQSRDERYALVGDKMMFKDSNLTGTVRLWYIPVPDKLTLTTDIVEGVSGWEEYIVLGVAIRMLDKQEGDSRAFVRRRKEIKERIENAAQNRNVGAPHTVTDTRPYEYDDLYWILGRQ